MTLHATDLLTFGGSACLVLAYQIYLGWRTRTDPASSAQDIMLAARAAWVASVMRERRDILAVQTLRNSTMSASFMASTAVLLIIGVLTLSAQGDKLSGTWHALNFLGQTSTEMWMFKLLMMLFDLLFAFFSFATDLAPGGKAGELRFAKSWRISIGPAPTTALACAPTTSPCRCCSGFLVLPGCWVPHWPCCTSCSTWIGHPNAIPT